MPNYKEQTVTGQTWIRSYRATCSNGHARKTVWFDEEHVVVGSNGERITAREMGHGCGMDLTADNATTAFPLLDADGNPTGQTTTYSAAYLMLMSLYYHVAQARDQAEAANV